jgi:hypothetical protein
VPPIERAPAPPTAAASEVRADPLARSLATSVSGRSVQRKRTASTLSEMAKESLKASIGGKTAAARAHV